MKTTKIFNGKKLIEVSEGSLFYIEGVQNWDIGTSVIFQVRKGIEVVSVVNKKDSKGTEFFVKAINEESDVEEPVIVEEVVEEPIEEEVIKFNKKNFIKKDLINFIKENNIDIKTNMSKADIVQSLSEMGYM